jgi:hypothetical protein
LHWVEFITHSCFDTYAISFSEANRCKANIGRGQDNCFLSHRQESKQIREQRNMHVGHPVASELDLMDRQASETESGIGDASRASRLTLVNKERWGHP